MTVLLGTHGASFEHDTGRDHAESPERLAAALAGIEAVRGHERIIEFEPRRATETEIGRVHDLAYIADLEERCRAGGGALDVDTRVATGSFEAAMRAAGAGPDAIERLDREEADTAFLALRPPGHHAIRGGAMGFCLVNNVAVTAAALVERGERVLILDWDAHHGNGTQEAFYRNPDVLFVSLHQHPCYPGTGLVDETGSGAGVGATINLPLPPGTSGDAYRLAFDEVIVPAAELFSPTWLLVSAGFDAHRADPLTDLGLSSGDFGDLTERALKLVPPGRRIFFLEGGYNLDALAQSVGAAMAAILGVRHFAEPVTSGGMLGADPDGQPAAIVNAARALHERQRPW